ncbi:hypothetical protein L210DRAFT_3399926, partial [Boletus edulis BED1]
ERERDRLSAEITVGFEELLSSSNVLNRKLEEVLGMADDCFPLAELMRCQNQLDPRTVPGTGTHIVSTGSRG